MGIIRELPVNERPREKGMLFGIESLSNRELLALLLRSGIPGHSVLDIADALIERAGGVGGLCSLDRGELCSVNGISSVKALELQASFELCRRMTFEAAREREIITDPEMLIRWFRQSIGARRQEHFLVAYLDTAGHLLSVHTLFIGTLNASMVSPREIFREALLQSAASVILAHNHPGGSLRASHPDIAMTAKIMTAARYMDIEVLDHLIITADGYLSMRREGLMKPGKELTDDVL